MLNVDVEIMIMSCQRATIITNVDVTNTNNDIADIFGTRSTMDVKFIHVNRFDNI